jgi:hypothetical protein
MPIPVPSPARSHKNHERDSGSTRFFDLSLWLPSAEKALLVLQGEGMLEGSAELSEFALTADPFPWQGTRTLQQVYIAASEERRPGNMVLGWNLTSIQRARFGAIGKDG